MCRRAWLAPRLGTSRLTGEVGGNIAQALLDRPRDAQPRIRTQGLQQIGGLWPGLELERLLGAFRHAIRRAPSEVPRVDVGTVLHEKLDDLIQAAKDCAV